MITITSITQSCQPIQIRQLAFVPNKGWTHVSRLGTKYSVVGGEVAPPLHLHLIAEGSMDEEGEEYPGEYEDQDDAGDVVCVPGDVFEVTRFLPGPKEEHGTFACLEGEVKLGDKIEGNRRVVGLTSTGGNITGEWIKENV